MKKIDFTFGSLKLGQRVEDEYFWEGGTTYHPWPN